MHAILRQCISDTSSSVLNEYYALNSFSFSTFFAFLTELYNFYTDLSAESIVHTRLLVSIVKIQRKRARAHQ